MISRSNIFQQAINVARFITIGAILATAACSHSGQSILPATKLPATNSQKTISPLKPSYVVSGECGYYTGDGTWIYTGPNPDGGCGPIEGTFGGPGGWGWGFGGGGGGGGGGSIASTECLPALGCSMQLVQDTTLPDTVDPSTITDAPSACAAIGESFDSVHSICFSLGTNGRAQFGWGFTTYTWGQCDERLTGMHPSYDYQQSPTGQYSLFCAAPGSYTQPATAWYNVELTFLAVSGNPIAIGIEYAVPAGQLFDEVHPTSQAVFSQMGEQFCPSDHAGNFLVALCAAKGGGISVGVK